MVEYINCCFINCNLDWRKGRQLFYNYCALDTLEVTEDAEHVEIIKEKIKQKKNARPVSVITVDEKEPVFKSEPISQPG